jgi:hypothetical protein
MTIEQLVSSAEVLDWYNNHTLGSLADSIKKQESMRAEAIVDMTKKYLPKEYKVATPQNTNYKFLDVRKVKDNPEDFFFVVQDILSTKVMGTNWKDYFASLLAYSPTLGLLFLRSPLWLVVSVGSVNLIISKAIKYGFLYFIREALGFDLYMVIGYKKSNPTLYKEYIAAMAHKATNYVVNH